MLQKNMISQNLLQSWLETQWPVSFLYDHHESESYFARWKKSGNRTKQKTEHAGYTQYELKYSDPETQLTCTLEIKSYTTYPALDWVMYFENNGKESTPILEDILAFQWMWEPGDISPCTVHYNKGSMCQVDDFLPLSQTLKNFEVAKFAAIGGRSSQTYLPFFHLECEQSRMIVAIGWTGQWVLNLTLMQATKNDPASVIMELGLEKTHLKLRPGEKIRTPRVLVVFPEKGQSKADAQNLYRHLILDYYSPKIQGKRVTVPLFYPTWGGSPITEHLERIAMIQKQKLAYEYYWVDAAWFLDESEKKWDEASGTWAKWVGRWRPNKILYPKGIKELSDAIHKAGMKFLLWFEPERARRNTEWPTQHPDYFLERNKASDDILLNLSDPKVQQFLLEFLTQFIKENEIDCYRQDFNFDPLPYWQAHDTEDRQGMSEILHIQGLYMIWDELLKRFPHLFIDNCSSGGRRIDLETISRSIPLWRSDTQCFQDYDPTASQVATYGLMQWAPLSSTGTENHPSDSYYTRSCYSTGLVFHHILFMKDLNLKTYPWEWHRSMIEEFKRARPFFEGDYYSLGQCTIHPTDWCVMQFNRPDLQGGIVLAFRRPLSPYIQAEFKLSGLDPKKNYKFEDADTKQQIEYSGNLLSKKGLKISIEEQRSAKLFFYSSQ
jgi:alpha-galactosidase